MSKPDITDFELCRTFINEIVNLSLKKRNSLLVEGQITQDEYIKIGQKFEEPLRRNFNDLTIKIFQGITQALTAHQTRINLVTKKIETTINKINNINESIKFFTKIVSFFGSILSAASLGIAGIPSLLNNFEALL